MKSKENTHIILETNNNKEMEKVRPKYTLGKINNKYLIMEIAAYALYDYEAFYLTYSASRMH
jgi:hypothetical protein